MNLEFKPILSKSRIKELGRIYKKNGIPRSTLEIIDMQRAKINGTVAYEIQKKGIRKVKYILFVYDFSIISIMGSRLGGNKLKFKEFSSFEKAEAAANKHINKFISSLL